MDILQERLDIQNAHAFQDQLVRLIETQAAVCELDASRTEIITTPNLQLLLACHKALARTGSRLKIINPSDAFRQAVARLGLHELLDQ